MTSSPPESASTPPRTECACELCGRKHETDTLGVALIAMLPGPDGKDWWLCPSCYWEGRKPQKLGNIPAQYKVVEEPAPARRRKAG